MSEREIELPFVLEHAKGKFLLDVGMDTTGYSEEFRKKGWTVRYVDPVASIPPFDYRGKFEEVDIKEKFNTIIFLSSMEHFNNSIENLRTAECEIFSLCKCRSLLEKDGIVILTVPFGREYIHKDFIQWSKERLKRILDMSDFGIKVGRAYKLVDGKWTECKFEDCENNEYVDEEESGQGHASAVYMAVLTP